MKIVFSMRHSGALRNFASTVEELARRGHRIHLIFMRRDKLGESRLLRRAGRRVPGDHLRGANRQGVTPVDPSRPGRSRSVGDYARYRAPAYKDAHALRDRATRHLSPSTRRLIELPLLRTRAGLRVAHADTSTRRTRHSGRSVRARHAEESGSRPRAGDAARRLRVCSGGIRQGGARAGDSKRAVRA